MTEKSKYEQLAAIDVTAHIEKKNNLSYLSWAWAVDQLLRADPAATWTYNAPMEFGQTVMVSCTVTAFNKPMTMQLPVMDFRNKAIPSPDSFAVNTAMMRCLVKAIALHGLGLYIYAGEDLPLADDAPPTKPITPTSGAWESLPVDEQTFLQDLADEIIAHIADGDIASAVQMLEEKNLHADEKVAIWTRFDSKQRSAMKKQIEASKKPVKELEAA